MIRVNKKHSVQYKNGYYTLREHGVIKEGSNVGKECNKGDKTYPSLEAMILQSDFDMSYEYTDAALKSKAEYESKWNTAHLAAKAKKDEKTK